MNSNNGTIAGNMVHVTSLNNKKIDYERVYNAARELIAGLGYDLEGDLADTPMRYANFWKEFIEYDAGKVDTAFSVDHNGVGDSKLVIVSGISTWSICEHHLLPFWCDVTVAYIPNSTVIGLSKIARIVHKNAHALQLQERLVEQIANDITTITNSRDVAVIAKGKHTCMIMRGIKTDGIMTTSKFCGTLNEQSRRYEIIEAANKYMQ